MLQMAAAPHRFLGIAQTHLSVPRTKPAYSNPEMAHRLPFQAPLLRTFPQRNNHHTRHAATEFRRNGHRDPTLRRCHHRPRQAKQLLHRNYAKRRGSPYAGMKSKLIRDPCPLIRVAIFE